MSTLLRRRLADAHEGPVYVAAEDALYFASGVRRTGDARGAVADICRWDLARDAVDVWLSDAPVPNGMSLSCEGDCLLVCEQGHLTRPSAVARYRLADGHRISVVDEYAGRPFNSINKCLELAPGTYVFSDPDYGRRQGFRPTRLDVRERDSFVSPETFAQEGRPPDSLPPSLYLHREARTYRLAVSALSQPHGLAYDPERGLLYVSDTAADDGGGGYDPTRSRRIVVYSLDAVQAKLTDPREVFVAESGIPDGMACDRAGRLCCATGDGVHVLAPDGGGELAHLRIDGGAVNLCLDEPRGRLFVTVDDAVEVHAWPAELA